MPVIGTFSAIKDGYATFGLGLTMGVFGLWAEVLSGPSGGDRVVLHPTDRTASGKGRRVLSAKSR
jgi:hypothetical protein